MGMYIIGNLYTCINVINYCYIQQVRTLMFKYNCKYISMQKLKQLLTATSSKHNFHVNCCKLLYHLQKKKREEPFQNS